MSKKNIIIVGATGGIGIELVKHLGQKHNLFLLSRNSKKLSDIYSSSDHKIFNCDVTDPLKTKSTFQAIFDQAGKIDGLVNLAGSIFLKPAHLTSDEDWHNTISQNLTTSFNCIKHIVPHASGNCSVVLISSVAGIIGLSNHEAIAAAKAGVIGLMKSAAATYATKGIRFNCISPGLVETPLSSRITSNPAALNSSIALHPLGRIGKPEDIASAINYLLEDISNWVTGQTFSIDGGLSTIK